MEKNGLGELYFKIDIFKNIYKMQGEKRNSYFFFYIYLKEKNYFTMTANSMTYGDLKDCVVREVNYLILYNDNDDHLYSASIHAIIISGYFHFTSRLMF